MGPWKPEANRGRWILTWWKKQIDHLFRIRHFPWSCSVLPWSPGRKEGIRSLRSVSEAGGWAQEEVALRGMCPVATALQENDQGRPNAASWGLAREVLSWWQGQQSSLNDHASPHILVPGS